MKIYNYDIVFREFPNETTLALNISGCPFRCTGCHSKYLQEDWGVTITRELIHELVLKNSGITCLGIMGGDADFRMVENISRWAREVNPDLKIGWYSGRDELPPFFHVKLFNYIKLGHYDKDKGPLTSPTTNQRMYAIWRDKNGEVDCIEDITNKFHKS